MFLASEDMLHKVEEHSDKSSRKQGYASKKDFLIYYIDFECLKRNIKAKNNLLRTLI